MGTSAAPVFDPQSAWEALVAKGLSKQEASKHVLRQVLNQPREIAAQFLRDVDPGKLAAFGLGMADMMSFGLGDQIARKLDEEAGPAASHQAALTQVAAKELHGGAHVAGEVAGLLTPLGAEMALRKAGVMAPMAMTKFIQALRNPYLRWGGRTALSAAEGAGYAAAQAAGRTEGDIGDRLEAAGEAAPLGALAGAALHNALPVTQVALDRAVVRPARYFRNILTDVMERAAGKPVAPRDLPNINMDLTPEGVGILSPVRRPAGDPLDVPTFRRRAAKPEPPPPARLGPNDLLPPGEMGILSRQRPPTPLNPGARGPFPEVPTLEGGVNTGAADVALRSGNVERLERFDPMELAQRIREIDIGPKQLASVRLYLLKKLGRQP